MRPCRQCRSPIENNVATCPHCGAAQDEGAKSSAPVPPPVPRRRLFRRAPAAPAANPDSPARRRSFVAAVFDDIYELLLAPESFAVLVGLLVVGAVVGGALAGGRGVVAGVAGAVIAIVLCFVLLRLLSSSEG